MDDLARLALASHVAHQVLVLAELVEAELRVHELEIVILNVGGPAIELRIELVRALAHAALDGQANIAKDLVDVGGVARLAIAQEVGIVFGHLSGHERGEGDNGEEGEELHDGGLLAGTATRVTRPIPPWATWERKTPCAISAASREESDGEVADWGRLCFTDDVIENETPGIA